MTQADNLGLIAFELKRLNNILQEINDNLGEIKEDLHQIKVAAEEINDKLEEKLAT